MALHFPSIFTYLTPTCPHPTASHSLLLPLQYTASFPHVLCKDCKVPHIQCGFISWLQGCYQFLSFSDLLLLWPMSAPFVCSLKLVCSVCLSVSPEPVCLSFCLQVSFGFHLSCNKFMSLHLPASWVCMWILL